MGRTVLTILGIAAIAIGAVFFAQRYVSPAKEQAQAKEQVLTHAYKPSLVECRVFEDAEIPDDLPKPGVDEDLVYVGVVVLYPGVDRVPNPSEHRLIGINGRDAFLDPVHADTGLAEDGTELVLIFKTDNSFRFGRLVRGDAVLFDRVELEN
jgi:hypothetical protein